MPEAQDAITSPASSPHAAPGRELPGASKAAGSAAPPLGQAAARPTETFGNRTVKGLAWLTLRTVGSKGVSFAGQIALAWLLSPKDFGLIGLAYTVSSVVGMLNNFGIEQVLVHRHKRFDRWANSAFWMSLAMGLAAAMVMAGVAPLAARMYAQPRLVGLLLVLAVAAPLGNLVIVPKAKVQAQLRFRFMAVTGFVRAAAMVSLTVLFAALGFEAYSFVLPMPIMALVMAVWYWRAAPSRILMNVEWRRWRFLFGDSALLFLAGLCYVAYGQGDYFTLGLFYSAEIVGIYYFAFNLSMQAIVLFSTNFSSVLFPVLSKLNDDPSRQAEAFMRSTRILALLAIPVCFLQAAVAAPVVHLLFDARWHNSIPVLQILSVAMALRVVNSPGNSLLMAQGRFRTVTWMAVTAVVIFFPLVMIGAWWNAAVGVACGVFAFFAIFVPLNLYVILRPGGVPIPTIARLYLPAFMTAGFSMLAAFAACFWLGRYSWGDIPQIVLVCLLGFTLYGLTIRKIDAQAWGELMARLRPIFARLGCIQRCAR